MLQTFRQAYQAQPYTYHVPLHTNFPFPWYQEMRATAPLFYDESLHAWSLFRYEDIQKALAEVAIFSSQMSLEPADGTSLSRTDPPLHRRLRSVANRAFTPRRIASLTPLVEDCVAEVLDPLLECDRIDGIQDIAAPIPVMVISRLLGVPPADCGQLRRRVEEGLSVRNPELLRTNPLRPGMAEIHAYFCQLIQTRRRCPQSDLISEIIQAVDIEARAANDAQLAGLFQSLYVAGHLTTINLIGNTLLCLQAYPEAQHEASRDPSLLAGVIEEVLRFCSPVQSLGRLIARDCEIGGCRLQAGETALLWIGSANHDELAFREPTRFEIRRGPDKHLAFGRGIHFCIGASLARLEALTTLRLLLERMEQLELAQGNVLEPFLPRSSYGVKSLSLTFRPRRKVP